MYSLVALCQTPGVQGKVELPTPEGPSLLSSGGVVDLRNRKVN